MKKHIEKIKYQPKNLIGELNIHIAGKDLIITGSNGCGKTTFLNAINKHIQHIYVEKKHDAKEQSLRNLAHWKKKMDQNPKGTSQYAQGEEQYNHIVNELEKYDTGVEATISDAIGFCALLDGGKAIYKYFIAERKSEISASSGATKASLDDKILKNKFQANEKRLGNEFENHLVNLKTRQSFAETYDKDFELSNKLQQWFDELEKNISILMEDDSFKLKFDSDGFRFLLTQDNKLPYSFQKLSSGYSSIFNILSELIMMTEAYKTSPQDMQGVVLIDEIDAHLHVSLQRKILPFLSNLYPNIQFIVTTHSPFVIGSLDNAVVYDLSSKQEFTNLSNYSYETIVEGLLGVPVVSMSLEKDIKRLSIFLAEDNPDTFAVTELVEKLSPHDDKLDDESAVFLIKAKMFLRDNKKEA
ncbi:AAA family ATPase [Brenneria roseae subsp. roseae]|uniref:AAA family ATPase n=1 Tax=Brenneria roseae TaxID=1509241 RepID=UPI000D604555|nr:AAA family ATPase [Brenneria roseae]PWC15466.1 AAA family ATPase [Brenneria roseae subsp. roseae]